MFLVYVGVLVCLVFGRGMALSLVLVRLSVALLLLSEPRLRRCTPLVLDRSFNLRALCSACEKVHHSARAPLGSNPFPGGRDSSRGVWVYDVCGACGRVSTRCVVVHTPSVSDDRGFVSYVAARCHSRLSVL